MSNCTVRHRWGGDIVAIDTIGHGQDGVYVRCLIQWDGEEAPTPHVVGVHMLCGGADTDPVWRRITDYLTAHGAFRGATWRPQRRAHEEPF